MSDSASSSEFPRLSNDDMLEINKDLERLIEDAENMAVQLTWMAYDMVALRTNPEVGASMRKLEDAFERCKTFFGDSGPEPEIRQESSSDTAAAAKPAET